jgi:hypothetical protein
VSIEGKGKGALCLINEALCREDTCVSVGTAPSLLTLAPDGGGRLPSSPSRFAPKVRAPGTHWIRSCVSPRTCLDAVE